MNFISKKIYVSLFFFVFLFSIVLNTININTIKSDTSGRYTNELVHDSTIRSVDNPWYTTQIKHYLNGDGFTIDPSDPIMSVRRTPGYPIFYGIHYALLGEETAHRVIPYTQAIIFALSAVVFGLTVSLVSKSAIAGYLSALMYGTSIFFIGFLFYTVTEAIHPSIVVFSLYFAAKYFYSERQYQNKYIFLSAIFCAIATLVRPTDGVLLVTLSLALLVNSKLSIRDRIRSISIVIVTFSIMFMPWVVHNYTKIGKIVILEAYYESEPFGGFGVKHTALINWWLAWGDPGGSSDTPSALGLHAQISEDTNTKNKYNTINHFVDKIVPDYAYIDYSREDLRSAFYTYQDCIEARLKKYSDRTSKLDLDIAREIWGPGTKTIDLMKEKWGERPLECEAHVESIFNGFEDKIKYGSPLRYYVISPFVVRGVQYIFHSNTNELSFLNPADREFNNFQFFTKAFFYVINVLLWLFSALYLFIKRSYTEKVLLGSFFVFTFLFLSYFRWVEVRYFLAVYPFMYLMSAITLKTLWEHSKKKIWR